MAYNQKVLDAYRADLSSPDAAPFKSRTCPYCNGKRDPTPKHQHPSTKPASPWDFLRHVLLAKYQHVQSTAARRNMAVQIPTSPSSSSPTTTTTTTGDKLFVVGPMVDQSELPFRMLCRQLGSNLAYTPMLHAKSFQESAQYRSHFFTTTPLAELRERVRECTPAAGEKGSDAELATSAGIATEEKLVDRPCIVQFCGHDADTVLAAARFAVRGEYKDASSQDCIREGDAPVPDPTTGELYYWCDAVDLNLGCPQGIARRGHYGAFLMEDWELIHTIIHTLHVELEVPVTVKIRVFDQPGGGSTNSNDSSPNFDEALTIRYARMIRDAGAQLLCIHGRTREMKGQQTGLADMALIARVRAALGGSIPVIANGNVRTYSDVLQHLRDTQCEGHMCAEPLLWDPALFADPPHPILSGRLHGADKATRLAGLQSALTYVRWLRRCPVDLGFAKAHLFKMCFHSYELHTGFRDYLANLKTSGGGLSSDGEGGDCCGAASVVCAPPAAEEAYGQHVDALEAHVCALQAAELACSVEGEQPKAAREAKAKERALVVDVFEEDGDIGINF